MGGSSTRDDERTFEESSIHGASYSCLLFLALAFTLEARLSISRKEIGDLLHYVGAWWRCAGYRLISLVGGCRNDIRSSRWSASIYNG